MAHPNLKTVVLIALKLLHCHRLNQVFHDLWSSVWSVSDPSSSSCTVKEATSAMLLVWQLYYCYCH